MDVSKDAHNGEEWKDTIGEEMDCVYKDFMMVVKRPRLPLRLKCFISFNS